MAGKRGRSGGARIGAGRKTKEQLAAMLAAGWSAKERTEPVFRDRPCAVYIVHEKECPEVCKIGIAGNAAKRFSALQVGTWRELLLSRTFVFSHEFHAHSVEFAAHELLSSKHSRGEWFSVTPEVAAQAVISCASSLGFEYIEDGRKNGKR